MIIVASLLLILVAIVLAVLGVVRGADGLLVGSIVASLSAAITLIVAARRTAELRSLLEERSSLEEEAASGGVEPAPPPAARPRTGTVYGRGAGSPHDARGEQPAGVDARGGAPTVTIPSQGGAAMSGDAAGYGDENDPVYGGSGVGGSDFAEAGLDDPGFGDDEDPPDEPSAQPVDSADAARVARLHAPVEVIDGRPRYHLDGCVHLLGRDHEALPVAEAVELGFTPCGLCEPDSALLAEARRV